MSELKFSEVTASIIGAAMEVHNVLGCGFPEVMYQRALAIELTTRNVSFEREFYMRVIFKGHPIGRKRVDFFIENKIMVEIKAFANLENADLVQAKNYLEAYNVEVGLLINFGSLSLQFKRLQNTKFRP